jgi:hypothetical protein
MGFGRAGWYSRDRLDNAGNPSADRIVPEWQSVQVVQRLIEASMAAAGSPWNWWNPTGPWCCGRSLTYSLGAPSIRMAGFHILTPGGTGFLCLPAGSSRPASAARRNCRRRVFGNYPRQVRSASLLSCLQAVLVHGGDMAVLRRHRLADVVLSVFFFVSRRAQVLVRSGLVTVGAPAGWRGARRRSG